MLTGIIKKCQLECFNFCVKPRHDRLVLLNLTQTSSLTMAQPLMQPSCSGHTSLSPRSSETSTDEWSCPSFPDSRSATTLLPQTLTSSLSSHRRQTPSEGHLSEPCYQITQVPPHSHSFPKA